MALDYPWSILAIEATTEKKRIKQAYAKRLKKCKPDDDSIAFQELHQAYKYALAGVNSEAGMEGADLSDNRNPNAQSSPMIKGSRKDDTKPEYCKEPSLVPQIPPDEGTNDNSLLKPRHVLEIPSVSNESGHQSSQVGESSFGDLEAKFNLLAEQITDIIEDPERFLDWQNWHMLHGSTDLLDTEFHDRMSLFVFKKLNDLIIPKRKQEARDFIVKQLDLLFGWSEKRKFFEEKLGVIACSYVLGGHVIS